MKRILSAICTLFLVAPALAAEKIHLTFTERSPLSSIKEFSKREGHPPAKDELYKLEDESFEAVIPKACSKENPHGLLVWISPGGEARISDSWFEVLEKRKLIWIGPNNAGNERDVRIRIMLALDAVHNMAKQYPVDRSRVYVSGFSGGGRSASLAAVAYPDAFTGGIFMMGSNFYRDLPVVGDPKKMYRATGSRPRSADLFKLAKSRPYVLLTGERDMNRDQTKANYEGFKKDGFTRATYVEIPGIGHNAPFAKWLDQAIETLDAPLGAPADSPHNDTGNDTRP